MNMIEIYTMNINMNIEKVASSLPAVKTLNILLISLSKYSITM